MTPEPITTLALAELLATLREQPHAVLAHIDADPLLKRRERADGLIIANAALGLQEPTFAHQLYAKGIVYLRAPYRLASLPLIKMYNHGTRPINDATTQALLSHHKPRLIFPEKLDGTLIQLFAHAGQVWLTTRSMMEGIAGDDTDDFPYLRVARALLTRDHPALLDPVLIGDKTLLFELIHPCSRQITHYGEREAMALLSVFDRREVRYWTTAQTVALAKQLGLPHPATLLEDDDLTRGVHRALTLLAPDEALPEGVIVCFEDEHQLLHRVKVKTPQYLERMAFRRQITLRHVTDLIWDKPALHDWDAFLAHVRDIGASEEEGEAFYRAHFNTFCQWYSEVQAMHAQLLTLATQLDDALGPKPTAPDASADHFKRAATWAKAHAPDHFGMLMKHVRTGPVRLHQLMWLHQPYPGFRATLEAAGLRG